MPEPVISVKGVSKKYRIGLADKKSDTIMATILKGIKSPLTNLKRIRNLSKLKDEDESIFWALKDVSFDVQEGEVLGIIGHNGAGKSTLLKLLSQITEPSAGEIRLNGRVAALLEVGTGFHPELTGRENIYMNGTILGMRKKEIDKKLNEIIDFSGVEKHLDTPVKFYSSGMRVRLGFSVAAHLEPEILIIDEVLSVGDAEFQKKCLGKMEDVSKNGRTVLFVSHNLDAVRSLCSKAILLKTGQLDFNSDVHAVIDRYISNYKTNILRRDFDAHDDAPGIPELKLLSAELISDSTDGILTIDTELKLIFKFYSDKQFSDFNLSLVLWSVSGTCIFNSITSLCAISKGEHYSQLTIPGGLLTNGAYNIELYFVSKSTKLFNIPELFVFELMDASRNGIMFGTGKGIVRPNLSFTIDNNRHVKS